MVINGDEVDQECCPTDQEGEQESGDEHLFDPFPAPVLSVEAAPEIAIDGGSGRIHEDCRRKHGPSFGIEFTKDGKDCHEENDGSNLIPLFRSLQSRRWDDLVS